MNIETLTKNLSPIYETILPFSGKKVLFTPFKVKDSKNISIILKEENKKKYDELTNNIFMLEEIIEELENKTNKILNDINYLEKIFNDSLNLFIDITKNKVN